MSQRRSIALNTLIQFIGKAITAGATFVTTILLARNFGVVGYGEYTKIAAYVALYLLVSDFGLNAVALPLMKERGDTIIFSHLFFLRLFFGIILATIAPLLALGFPYNAMTHTGFSQSTKMGILLLSTTVIFQGIFLSGNAVFQKNLRYDRSVLASSMGSIVTIVMLIAIVMFHGTLLWSLVAFVAGSAVMASATVFLLRPFIGGISLTFSPKIFKQLVTASLPIGITLIFNLIYLRANTFILAATRSTLEVGIFGLAYKFFEFILTIPTFFMNSVYPVLVERKSLTVALRVTVIKAMIFLFITSLFLLVLGYFAAPLLVLVKEDFLPAVLPFRILVLGLPFFFISSLFMWLLIVFNKRVLLLSIYGGSMVLSVTLNLVFVPLFGYIAAAILTVTGEAVVVFLTLLLTKDMFHGLWGKRDS